jgi:hypothetical protein
MEVRDMANVFTIAFNVAIAVALDICDENLLPRTRFRLTKSGHISEHRVIVVDRLLLHRRPVGVRSKAEDTLITCKAVSFR